MVLVFAFLQIEFNSDKDWSYINMSLQEIKPPSELREIEKVKIPKNFEEKGLDAKKYSVAKTNEAINEATNELSRAQKAKIEQDIAKQVQDMARNESTTDLGRKGPGSLEGEILDKKKSKKKRPSGWLPATPKNLDLDKPFTADSWITNTTGVPVNVLVKNYLSSMGLLDEDED